MKSKTHFLKKKWVIISSLLVLCICFFSYGLLTAPPTVIAANLHETTNPPVSASSYDFSGTVSPASQLSINNQPVVVASNGRFEYDAPLSEGDNTITMTVKKNNKTTVKSYIVQRHSKVDTTKHATNSNSTTYKSPANPEQPLAALPLTDDTKTLGTTTKNGSFGDGTFTIGKDIASGTYHTSTPENCHYESSSNNGTSVGNVTSEGKGKKELTIIISPNDKLFSSKGCGTWTKTE